MTATVAAGVGLLLPPSLVGGSLALLAGGTVAGWVLLASEGRGLAALGFPGTPGAVPETLWGLALGVALVAAVVGLIAVAGGVRWFAEPGHLTGWIVGGTGALLFLAIPAAAEEVLLRGYPLQALAEAWGTGRALVVTSGVFAVAHLGNPAVTVLALVNIGLAGLWLGIVWVRTGSLWWATGAHLGWNWGGAYLADLPVSGLELLDAPLYGAVASGPDWLGGGSFGPEGSVVTAAALLAASAWCARTRVLVPSEAVLAAGPLAPIGRIRLNNDGEKDE